MTDDSRSLAEIWEVVASLRTEARKAKASRDRMAEDLLKEKTKRKALEKEFREHVEEEKKTLEEEDMEDYICVQEAEEEEEDDGKDIEERRRVFLDDKDEIIERVMCQARRGGGAERPKARVHLVIGDSIAKSFPFSVQAPDRVLNLAVGGLSFRRLVDSVPGMLRAWRSSITDDEEEGKVVVWLGGNDVYPHRNHGARPFPAGAATTVLHQLLDSIPAHRLLLLGPLPRRSDSRWESSLACLAEARLAAAVRGVSDSVELVRHIGRPLADRNHRFTREGVFKLDGVHLTAKGYDRLAVRMPAWLKRE